MRPCHRVVVAFGFLAFLAAPSASVPAFAQADTPTASPDIDHSRAERRDLREERQLRAEREQIEAERDKLMAECMDAKGQDRSQCETKRRALAEKRQNFHKRMKAFHEKVEGSRQEHPPRGWRHATGTPGSQPATPPPVAIQGAAAHP